MHAQLIGYISYVSRFHVSLLSLLRVENNEVQVRSNFWLNRFLGLCIRIGKNKTIEPTNFNAQMPEIVAVNQNLPIFDQKSKCQVS